jgi:hypothetical protein
MSCTCLSGNRSKPGFWYRVLVRYRIAETRMYTGLQPHTINPISINKAAQKKHNALRPRSGMMSDSDASIAKFSLLQLQQDGRYCIGFGDLWAVAQRGFSARYQRDSAVQLLTDWARWIRFE